MNKIKNIFLIIIIMFVITLFSYIVIENDKKITYVKQMDFFKIYLENNYDISELIIIDFMNIIYKIKKEYPDIYNNVSIFDILAIGHVETRFRNIIGDEGDSLGYFQIQESTYWFVKSIYSDLFYELDFINLPWKWSYVEERADIQILTAILYLNYLRNKYENKVYYHYNGGSTEYERKILNELKNIGEDYNYFLINY